MKTCQDGVECINGNLAVEWVLEEKTDKEGEGTRRLTSERGLWRKIKASC